MKTYSVVRRITFAAAAGSLGCLLAAGIASSHDMAAMDGMGGADMGSMNHPMGPAAMGGHMQMMENHMRMTDLRSCNAGR